MSRFLVTIEFVVDIDVDDDINDAAMDIAESAAAASDYTIADWAVSDIIEYEVEFLEGLYDFLYGEGDDEDAYV